MLTKSGEPKEKSLISSLSPEIISSITRVHISKVKTWKSSMPKKWRRVLLRYLAGTSGIPDFKFVINYGVLKWRKLRRTTYYASVGDLTIFRRFCRGRETLVVSKREVFVASDQDIVDQLNKSDTPYRWRMPEPEEVKAHEAYLEKRRVINELNREKPKPKSSKAKARKAVAKLKAKRCKLKTELTGRKFKVDTNIGMPLDVWIKKLSRYRMQRWRLRRRTNEVHR